MFKNFGVFEKKIGIETTDKEVYVVNEAVDPLKFISLADLISENGGLLRIPFLTKTNAITYLIKYWGIQILEIIQELHSTGNVLNILRPENLYLSRDGQQIKLQNLRGIGKVN